MSIDVLMAVKAKYKDDHKIVRVDKWREGYGVGVWVRTYSMLDVDARSTM